MINQKEDEEWRWGETDRQQNVCMLVRRARALCFEAVRRLPVLNLFILSLTHSTLRMPVVSSGAKTSSNMPDVGFFCTVLFFLRRNRRGSRPFFFIVLPKAAFTWSWKDALFQLQFWKFTSYGKKIGAEKATLLSSCQQGLRKRLQELKKFLFSALKLSGLLHTGPKLELKRGTLLALVNAP